LSGCCQHLKQPNFGFGALGVNITGRTLALCAGCFTIGHFVCISRGAPTLGARAFPVS
jgi:hypothetical protein